MLYLYLVHRDLIDLTSPRNRDALSQLRSWSQTERVLVILSLEHLLETCRGSDLKSRRELADTADSLLPAWILSRGYLHSEEARAAMWQYLGVSTERYWPTARSEITGGGLVTGDDGARRYRLSVFRSSVGDTFTRDGDRTRHLGQVGDTLGFARMLDLLDSTPGVVEALKAVSEDAYPQATARFRQEYPKDLPGMDWFTAWTLDRACQGVALDHLVRADFLRQLDLRTCPSIYSMIQTKNQINREKIARIDASEMADIVHLSALPYVDLFSADKRICDFIRRAKLAPGVFPSGAVRQMETCRTLAISFDRIKSNALH